MKYLVMECHVGYAIVLDSAGRFIKVANQNYRVGQTVFAVVPMHHSDFAQSKRRSWRKIGAAAASLAACLCLMMLGAWQLIAAPYATVRMQINPDVQMTVNRLAYVIGVEGLNEDGTDLIKGYRYGGKPLDRVSDELADRAAQMGYLKLNGEIRISVQADHAQWEKTTEDRLIAQLTVHMGGTVTVLPQEPQSVAPEDVQVVIPVEGGDRETDNRTQNDVDQNDDDDVWDDDDDVWDDDDGVGDDEDDGNDEDRIGDDEDDGDDEDCIGDNEDDDDDGDGSDDDDDDDDDDIRDGGESDGM